MTTKQILIAIFGLAGWVLVFMGTLLVQGLGEAMVFGGIMLLAFAAGIAMSRVP